MIIIKPITPIHMGVIKTSEDVFYSDDSPPLINSVEYEKPEVVVLKQTKKGTKIIDKTIMRGSRFLIAHRHGDRKYEYEYCFARRLGKWVKSKLEMSDCWIFQSKTELPHKDDIGKEPGWCFFEKSWRIAFKGAFIDFNKGPHHHDDVQVRFEKIDHGDEWFTYIFYDGSKIETGRLAITQAARQIEESYKLQHKTTCKH